MRLILTLALSVLVLAGCVEVPGPGGAEATTAPTVAAVPTRPPPGQTRVNSTNASACCTPASRPRKFCMSRW